MHRPLELWLQDRDGRSLLFAYVASVPEGRKLWTKIAGEAGTHLASFEIKPTDPEITYMGNYVTDEC